MATIRATATEMAELEKKYGPAKGINMAALEKSQPIRGVFMAVEKPIRSEVTAFWITLPMPPTTNNLYKNAGKKRIATEEYNAWKVKAEQALVIAPAVKTPVSVRIILRPGKGWKMSSDAANREKATVDSLVHAGVLPGDSLMYVHKVSVEYRPLPAPPKGVPPVAIVMIQSCPIALVPLGSLPDDPQME